VSLYYLQHSAISAWVIHFHHVTKELFSSVTLFFAWQTYGRNDLKRLLDNLRTA
jgi:hypothetical protein